MTKEVEICALQLAADVDFIAAVDWFWLKLQEEGEMNQKICSTLGKTFSWNTFWRNLISLSMFRFVFKTPSTSAKSRSSLSTKDRPNSIFSSINSRKLISQFSIALMLKRTKQQQTLSFKQMFSNVSVCNVQRLNSDLKYLKLEI